VRNNTFASEEEKWIFETGEKKGAILERIKEIFEASYRFI
jgi:hypothetical protein